MIFLLQQLLGVVTVAQARQNLIDIAVGLGFNATSWQDGSIPKTLLFIFAEVYASLTHGIAQTAAGGYNDLAEDEWLHMLADSHYDNQVHNAVATQGTCVLTSSAFAPPYPISPDDLVATTADGSVTFRNKSGDTLATGGTLSLLFECEVAGAAGNVAPNTITTLRTGLAGVTITNPVLPGGTSWITRDGADIETNPELRTRNRTKWATLGIGPGMAYEHSARQADPAVKRVFVDDTNPNGPGTVDVYVAGDSGALSNTVLAAVNNYMTGVTDGIDRVNTTAILAVKSAINKTVVLSIGVYLLKQYDTTITRTSISDAVAGYFKALPIGGTPLQEGGPGAVRLNALAGNAMKIAGVQNVVFTNTLVDPPLAKNEVAIPVVSFVYYQV